jgi:biopolymer transport protein ExbD
LRSPKLVSEGTATINMTPMIDVVFLLIIFFLVSSHLAKQENTIPLKLPIANSGLDDTSNRQSVVVNVLPDGAWMIGGANVQQAGLDKALRSRVMVSEEPLQLRIRTDQSVTYDRIEPILISAAQLGIGDIVFSVFEERVP